MALAAFWFATVTHQMKASSFFADLPAHIFDARSLPCFTPQPTGMPLELSWSSLPCHALLASSPESSPLPTSRPLRGSTARLPPASCSLFQVSRGCHETCITEMFEVIITDMDFNVCHSLPTMLALFVLLAMAIYTGVTVNFLGKRFGDWRFSWSYILGWVALLMTFFAGLFKSRSAVEFSVIFLPLVNKISYTVIANWGTQLIFQILTTAVSVLEKQAIKSPIECCHIFLKLYLRSFLKLFIVSLYNLIRIALIKVPTIYF